MIRSIRMTVALFDLLLGLTAAFPAVAQEAAASPPNGRFAALEAINASYQQQRHDLECRRITDLAVLAEKSSGPEADAALRQLFSLAIAHSLCPQAHDAAQRCLRAAKSSPEVRALAALVQVLARTDKGEHDRAIADLKVIFRQAAAGGREGRPQDTDLALGVGEALLERLIHDGRYDVARKLCDVACDEEAPAAVKDHFEDRMARIDLVGKPAPPIAGTDVDGKPVSLPVFKGKVVLIDFWASWCPPCVAAIPTLKALSQKYQDRGFVILGINVDAMHEDVKETDAALQQVRRFLVKHRVGWINVLSGKGASDFAAAYRVEQIPASFLVGRDGSVVAVDQHGEILEQAVVRALEDSTKRREKE
jgi:thiol-disulfide isomerase/thioredoxin